MVRWLKNAGREYQPANYDADMSAFRVWLDVAGDETFTLMHKQSIDSFIECQHSRASWSRARMSRAEDFDRELASLLEPHSDGGQLCYAVQTRLVWGRPRSDPRDA